jgi:hypothetical protein
MSYDGKVCVVCAADLVLGARSDFFGLARALQGNFRGDWPLYTELILSNTLSR